MILSDFLEFGQSKGMHYNECAYGPSGSSGRRFNISCFCSMKGQEVPLPPHGEDASSLQGYLQHLIPRYPFITWVERDTVRAEYFSQEPWAGLEPRPRDPETVASHL